MGRNYIVYQSTARSTGASVRMLDTKHPDSKFPVEDGGRYLVECTTHATQKRFERHYDAGIASREAVHSVPQHASHRACGSTRLLPRLGSRL
jgi:hypothetical protein